MHTKKIWPINKRKINKYKQTEMTEMMEVITKDMKKQVQEDKAQERKWEI